MAIPLIIMGVAAAVSAGAQAYGGAASKRQRKKSAARMRMAANEARQSAAAEAESIREKGNRIQSEQKTAYAFAGVQGYTGTPHAVRLQVAQNIEKERQKALRAGEFRARSIEWGAESQDYMGKAEMTAGTVGAFTTLASAAGSIYAGATKT